MKNLVPVVPGFSFNGLAAGIKKNGNKDLGLIFSQVPAVAAGVFTRNWVKAAPVLFTRQLLQKKTCQAVIANSGCANACTGAQGMQDAGRIALETARGLDISSELVAVSSTGVIGETLPVTRMCGRLPELCNGRGREKIMDFAEAIMTTDTKPKIAWRRKTRGSTFTVAGIAKGAGMISPSLATMLVYLLTDAAVRPQSMEPLLRARAEETFNRITIDGDTSTNDTVLLLANGTARNTPCTLRSATQSGFGTMLFEVMDELAKSILHDGEGVTKVVEIKVVGASTQAEAEGIARSIANSPLVKTSFYGEEFNWGRIFAAAGKTPFPVAGEKMDLFMDKVPVVSQGVFLGKEKERQAQKVLGKKSFRITLALNQGRKEASVFTTDFSPQYVTINAGYKS
jgi:glutamate N-acetyltransferase / amino-acid N-acetyltransferase